MRGYSFNNDWFCRHLGESGLGRPVTLPHDAMLAEKRTATASGGLNVGWFEGMDYIYTKKFTLTAEELKKHRVIEFEGVYRKAEVRLNSKPAAFRPYGYTNFYVPIDKLAIEGENTLEVIARNSDQPNSRWYSGAGIYRPVTMWESGESYIEPSAGAGGDNRYDPRRGRGKPRNIRRRPAHR